MTIQRYELLDLTSADGPRAMVHEYEEGTYVLHADHVAEVAALKTRIAELEKTVEKCRQAYFAPPLDAAPKTPEDYRRTCADLLAALKGASQ